MASHTTYRHISSQLTRQAFLFISFALLTLALSLCVCVCVCVAFLLPCDDVILTIQLIKFIFVLYPSLSFQSISMEFQKSSTGSWNTYFKLVTFTQNALSLEWFVRFCSNSISMPILI